ncbi:A.superbus venom factor 1-like [Monodelphis domestica]|uniref:A.superbus venom factor 1-like n=1 Tax=Monodelphis domestica TaxID=13616 RepID=UPI0024E25414|nr:A.superbus venom factor 1-like [Monodelphis domestica]
MREGDRYGFSPASWASIMNHSRFTLLLLGLFFLVPSHSQRSITLITPNVMHPEREETILVEAHDLTSDMTFKLTFYDFPKKKHLSDEIVFTLDSSNRTAVVKIKIPSIMFKPNSPLKQYVTIKVKSSQSEVEKVVLISHHTGYIFIQTDKPIYTPGSTVLFRIYTLDIHLKPVSKYFHLDIQNPEGIVIKSQDFRDPTENGIFSSTYFIPELTTFGTWKIVARYEDAIKRTFSTEFEIKEYVLPSFEVTLEPSEKFFYIDGNDMLEIDISARYIYGKPVDGVAFVLFGVMKDGHKEGLPHSLQRVHIEEGVGTASLDRATVQRQFANLNELVGQSLYVTVSVLTDTGSDMVEAERRGISIVTSPYQIHFTKTSKYFKPGIPFEFMVFVTNPDGSPATEVPVLGHLLTVDSAQSRVKTLEDGRAKLIINTPGDQTTLSINVSTADPRLPDERQAIATMVINAYRTFRGSQNYLHIGVSSSVVKPGDHLHLQFVLKNTNIDVQNQIKNIFYLILNQGRIVKHGQQIRGLGQTTVSMTLEVESDLIPSFRIVAYYYVSVSGHKEIVADAVWVDVKDTCIGSLVVKAATRADDMIHPPSVAMKLKLEGDPGASVALVAVDKGVYVLNKKKFTQEKVWNTIEEGDLGCSPGGGQDVLEVFTDAGLSMKTTVGIETPLKSELACKPLGRRRRRRSLQLLEEKAAKVSQYQDQELRRCCEQGMNRNPMNYNCEKRTYYIVDESEACKEAFLNCCRHIQDLKDKLLRPDDLILARSDLDEEILSEEKIASRSRFPESWLWDVEHLAVNSKMNNKLASKIFTIYLKDSITTWEVLAVSVSKTKGICVASPYEITVMKDFFIDLKLPYSAVRNEQVEIRAVLYNYNNRYPIKVRVELLYNPAFCSSSTVNKRYRQTLTIEPSSSRVVPLTIIPLMLGMHDIEVKAAVWGAYVADGIRKTLKVVPEGIKIKQTVLNVFFDPSKKGKDNEQNVLVKAADLENMVPGTESETQVIIQGNPIADIIEETIDGKGLSEYLRLPEGCAEQTLSKATRTIISTHYLDSTQQWDKVGINRRKESINYIKEGFAKMLTFKKSDHSFATFPQNPSSTWMTAYWVKVFSMASGIMNIDRHSLCGSVNWLILQRQRLDGSFFDTATQYSYIMGGDDYKNSDVAFTGFMVTALEESRPYCGEYVPSLNETINKAVNFLAQKYPQLTQAYEVTLASYALALMGRLDNESVLLNAVSGGDHWEDKKSVYYSIEATSYGLLSLIHLKKFQMATEVAQWLMLQKIYEGTYGSTQSLVMALQALAEYQQKAPRHKNDSLEISLHLPGRQSAISYRIDYSNSLLSQRAETKLNQDFTVKAKGTGQATMTVVTTYYAKPEEQDSQCHNFSLRISVKNETRESKLEETLGSVSIEICMRFLGVTDAAMTILDVSMLTGFSPDIQDLNLLSSGIERYISKFEINKSPSDRGTLIIYLDKVSHKEEECIKFKAHQFFEVGLIQPAAVKIYEYYALENRCTQFYHSTKAEGQLNKICTGEVCRCAEDHCFMQENQDQIREETACHPGVDFVYKTTLLSMNQSISHDTYRMKILRVIKPGSDDSAEGKERDFISHVRCRDNLRLEIGKDYLIWGATSDLWKKSEVSYIITQDTNIEKWPNNEECKDQKNQKLCEDLDHFTKEMTFGCRN